MSNSEKRKNQTKKLVLGAVLTAIVVVLQLLGAFIRFGPFSISLVLVPIVLGAAMCGVSISTWLGFVFGVAVLMSGDAAAFMQLDVLGTIITVLLKGTLAGLASGLAYKMLCKLNTYIALVVAAFVCPIINTGIFVLGCFIFFLDDLVLWAPAGQSTVAYIFLGLVGGNFLFEVATNIILSPIIYRLLNIEKKKI